MKTNDYLLIGATAAYSILFYEQNAGINFLLFSVILLALLLIRNKVLIKDKRWVVTAGLVLFSSVCIFIHSSALAIIGNIISLLILSGLSFNPKTSSLFNFMFTGFSIASAFIFMIIDGVKRREENSKDPNKKKNYKWLGALIVIFVSFLFFLLYRASNPLFAENTKWLNFDLAKLSWFIFTGFGFYFMYAFLYHKTIPFIERWENGLNVELSARPIDENRHPRMETEKFSLIVLFSLLNIMLLVLNTGDANTILLNGKLPEGIKLSDFVHESIAALIFSIVFGIVIIMYFLRNDLNFYKGNRFFKSLVLLWIFQNALMVLSASWRNNLYISEYTLTHLRIGVYVWLVLAFIGLVLTAIKITSNKSNWFLVRTNFSTWIVVLVLSGSVDWDLTIARYNLQNKKINEIDYNYLFSLSDTAIPELITFCKEKLATERVPITKNINERDGSVYYAYPFDYLNLMHNKLERYLGNYTSDIRSWDLRDKRIMEALN
jgi:hypothetical protein